MTSRERMMAAFRCQEPDLFPIHVRGVRAWDRHWCETRHPSYRPLIEAVREHGAYEVGWNPGGGLLLTGAELPTSSVCEEAGDWIVTRTTIETPRGPLTSVHKSSTRGLPGLQVEFPIKTMDDVERVLSVPYEPVRIDPAGFFAAEAQIGDRGIVMCALPVPIYRIAQLTGSDLLAIWSIEQRALIHRLIEVFLERTLDLLDALIAAGVGPIYATSGEEFMTPPLAGPRDFREFVVAPGQPVRERLQRAGMLRHIHCHGPINALLEDFVALGANCLHPVEPPPLGDVTFAEAKRRIGDRVCLEGNIQIGDLYHDPTELVVAKVRATCEVGAPGGGFILCPTASPHTAELTDLTVANYLAMIETAVAIRGG